MSAALFDAPAVVEKPTGATIRALEGFGFKADAVRKWSKGKAEAKLHECKKQQAIDLAKSKSTAAAIEEEGVPPDPIKGRAPTPICCDAADYIEEALAKGNALEIMFAVRAAVYCLADARTKKLADHLARVLRGAA